jgi:hypothetical protein
MSYDVMPDFTHSAVTNVPPNGPYSHVGGYTSGTPDILWTPSDWSRYSKQIHIRYEQGYGGFTPNMADYDVLDIEKGAWTPEAAATEVKRRVEAGYQWTTLYGGDADLAATSALIVAMGPHIWDGHVDCILANWNLDEAQAAAIVGTEVHGMTCRGVQWASPESNPNTNLPGTAMTLAEANVDLTVVQAGWNPPTVPRPVPVPVPVPTPTPTPTPTPAPVDPPLQFNSAGVVVWQGGTVLHTREVVSEDGGKTWH